jgi:amidase
MVPLADGSDSGGSLRNPSAFCSVLGLRVAPGRVPNKAAGNAWSTIGVSGPMARSVSDVALLLSVMAGPDPRCPISITEPGAPFSGNLERSFKGVRVAWFKDLGGIPFDRRIREGVNAQRRVFESLGCIVEEAEPDWTGADEAFNTLRALGYASSQSENVRKHRELVKDTILWEVERGSKLTAAEIARAESLHSQVWDRMRVFQENYEYFILPAVRCEPALRDGDRGRENEQLHRMDEGLLFHFDRRESFDFHAQRIHAGRFAGGSPDCGAASRGV